MKRRVASDRFLHKCIRSRRAPRVALATCALAPLLAAPSAHADLGVALADPTTVGVSPWTHAGHSLVYLSGVCADTPVHARLCAPGEQGSVVTMYPDFYEDQPYAWNLVPLSLYLDGSLQPGNRLLYGSPRAKAALELHARDHFLAPVCTVGACVDAPHRYWHDLSAATIDRDIWVYAVHTTAAQDQAVVDWLNRQPNTNRYNSFTYNCSNFTQSLVNTVFPHSIHRDWLNDLGMMSPKAAAHFFTRYAIKHPELGLYSMHFTQQPGPMPRSGLARSGTEDGIHMKKYLIPAALIGDHEVAGSFFVSYFLTGRFGLYNQYKKYAAPSLPHPSAPGPEQAGSDQPTSARLVPAPQPFPHNSSEPLKFADSRNAYAIAPVAYRSSFTASAAVPASASESYSLSARGTLSSLVYGPVTPAAPASTQPSASSATPPPPTQQAQNSIIGSPQTWTSYRVQFQSLLRTLPRPGTTALVTPRAPDSPVSQTFGGPYDAAYTPTRKHPFPQWFATAVVTVDSRGRAWLWAPATPGFPSHAVGLDSTNLLAPASDPALARQLILGRLATMLDAKGHQRETLPEFQQDWALLQSLAEVPPLKPDANSNTLAEK